MSESFIQQQIYNGYGYAANVLGQLCTQYRSNGSGIPTAPGNSLGTINAAFTTDPKYGFIQPLRYGKVEFFGLFNATGVNVGDYIVTPNATQIFFVASLEPLVPPLCVLCNLMLTVSRPEGGTQAGSNPPSGDAQAIETTLLSGWPGAAVTGGRADAGQVELPGDIRMGGWTVYLPVTPGVTLRGGDILTDATGLRRIVSSAEPSARGWRMICLQEAT